MKVFHRILSFYRVHRALSLVGTGATVLVLFGAATLVLRATSPDRMSRAQFSDFRKARADFQARRFAAARRRLSPLRRRGRAYVPARMLAARIDFYTRRFASAERELRAVLAEQPDQTAAAVWLGRVLLVRPGGNAEAVELFGELVRRNPENHMARYYLGRALERRQDYRGAIRHYQRALAAEYQLSRIHLHMARLFHRLRLQARAQRHAHRVRALAVSKRDMREAGQYLNSTRSTSR